MKYLLFICFFLLSTVTTYAAKPKTYYVKITTKYGESVVKLYNETPKHRDNFIKLIKKGTLNNTLFHRVIKDFMIQGGDPDSKNAKPSQMLGNGNLGYLIPAEFNPNLFHKKGALAAARDGNPEKASNASQFYLVQGRVFTEDELKRIEEHRLQGRKIPAIQREAYKTLGGAPHLDQNYTVFGEVVKGIEQIDSIAALKADNNNRPLEDVRMEIKLLKKREIKKLEKELIKQSFKNSLLMNK